MSHKRHKFIAPEDIYTYLPDDDIYHNKKFWRSPYGMLYISKLKHISVSKKKLTLQYVKGSQVVVHCTRVQLIN